MTHLVDVRDLSVQARFRAADKIQTLPDFDLPELTWFNNKPCDRHATLAEGLRQLPSPCRRCGIKFRRHQRVGIAWLYMRGHGLIADQVGLGKTGQAAGLLAVIKQNGELSDGRRVVVVCRPAAIDQWVAELHRFLPRMTTIDNTGVRAKRIEKYVARWDILVTGYQMLLRDHEHLDHFKLGAFVIDDVDSLRHRKNQSAAAIKRIARASSRVIILNATPLQKKLLEMHSMLEPVGGYTVFGSETSFRRTYERTELVTVYNKSLGREVVTKKTIGYKNVDDFIARIRPMVLRRTAAMVADDIDRPEISPPHDIYLDLYPAQKAKYDELRTGVLKIIKAEGTKVKRTAAASRFVYGAMICAGLATLGQEDLPGTSVKLDWVVEALTGDLADEKVVVFANFTNTVAALQARLDTAGVGNAVIWGRDNRQSARAEAKRRFWDDPDCRVLIGTSAIEASLNLQVARHIINMDQLLNPARMQQIVGRIARDGSAHAEVFVHNLLARGTQEEHYIDALRTEQALSDVVWGESNQLFEALSPMQLLMLIGRK